MAPELHDDLAQKGFSALLRLAVTRDGDPFVLVLKVPSTGAPYESWYSSALDAATLAETEWVQMEANKGMGCYDVNVAVGIKVEPQWPDLAFPEILRLCFKDRFASLVPPLCTGLPSGTHGLLLPIDGEVPGSFVSS